MKTSESTVRKSSTGNLKCLKKPARKTPILIDSVDSEMLATARHLYQNTMTTLVAIARFLDVDVSTVKRYFSKHNLVRGAQDAMHPDGRGVMCPGIGLCPVRGTVHRRLHADLERRLSSMEQTHSPESPADREREVRSFSSMVRTVQKLQEMDRAAAQSLAPVAEEQTPYDVEQLRQELSDKLARLYRQHRNREPPP